MRVISKAASILWKAASHEEKSIYQKIASRVHEIYALRNSRPRLPVLPPIKPLKHSLSPPYPSFVTRPTTFNNIRIDIDYNRNKQKPYNPHSVYNVLNH
ncbi:hypothetical protein GLOIN_2v1774217 [Rhizophagus clarus]|nr:hypothetical protein GLOIN_2v1774217 [Rhizophagus clarus]